MTAPRVAVLVLGAHRSGTSAMARVINLLGVDLGREMLPPKFDNRHGYWENRAVFELHERLLSKAGSAWHDYRPMAPGWQERDEVVPLRGELLALLEREVGDSPLWGVKDPRLGRLLPLWLDVLAELAVEPRFLIVVRNPLEVVDSIERRNDFTRSKSLLLCLADLLVAVRCSEAFPRSFVCYGDLLADWRPVAARVARELAIEWPRPAAEVAGEIDDYLRPGERHHRRSMTELSGDPRLPDWVATLYGALSDASRGDASRLADAVESASRSLASAFDLFLPEVDALEGRIAQREGELAQVRAELDAARSQLDRIRSRRLVRAIDALGRAWDRWRGRRGG